MIKREHTHRCVHAKSDCLDSVKLLQEIIIGKVLDFVELNAQVEEVATPSPSEVKA